MAGLLLLGLLACAPLVSPQPTLILSESCHHTIDIQEIQQNLHNFTFKMLPKYGKCFFFYVDYILIRSVVSCAFFLCLQEIIYTLRE